MIGNVKKGVQAFIVWILFHNLQYLICEVFLIIVQLTFDNSGKIKSYSNYCIFKLSECSFIRNLKRELKFV